MKGRGGRGPVKGAPERLAVQGHHALTALGEAAHEGHKTRLELGRIEQPKHAREGVMAWDAVPEREDLFEEGVLGAPEPDHVGAGLAPAQHGAQANEQDLQKLVALGIARARILQIRENRRKLLHSTTFDPKWCHRVEPVRLNSQANFLKCDSPGGARTGAGPSLNPSSRSEEPILRSQNSLKGHSELDAALVRSLVPATTWMGSYGSSGDEPSPDPDVVVGCRSPALPNTRSSRKDLGPRRPTSRSRGALRGVAGMEQCRLRAR